MENKKLRLTTPSLLLTLATSLLLLLSPASLVQAQESNNCL